jgi:hypothetical protein
LRRHSPSACVIRSKPFAGLWSFLSIFKVFPTPKQEKFNRLDIELVNGTEAYRQTYNCKGMSGAAINVEVCKLRKNPKIALRRAELQAEHAERHAMTIDRITGARGRGLLVQQTSDARRPAIYKAT